MLARSAVVPLVVAATSIVAPALLAAQPELADTVGTLELSRELDARGNLGGVTIDRLGFVYVANFRDALWKISPEGDVELVTRGLYGSSGNAVGPSGELYQANFFGDTISRISRTGEVARFADEGLEGPVGIAVADDGTLYVCNCRGNFVAAVSPSGTVSRLVEGDFFACPNGIVFGPDERLYVTNFNNHDILRVSTDGEAEVFATVPGGAGNAHIAFAKDFFFVTKIIAHQLVRVSLEGEVFPLAGTGRPGHDDGPAPEATLTNPNGIAVSPRGDVLYVNTVDGTYSGNQPSKVRLRTVELLTLTDLLDAAQEEGGVEALEAAYRRYHRDPVRGREDTVAEMVAYGYRHLSGGQIPAALAIFRLNAEANPEVPAAQYNLGEAYRYTGQTEAAIVQYERTLALDPEHRLARSRLAQLGDG
ncbi:MAG: tetratricopeptide repeat protein [Thermoanaerobaculia bacterium]|nr:tetratricopeptide repeat protein [Thermoanaerobaculia bacterium]